MVVIILWMLGFALLHSLTADKRVKTWIGDTFGERFRQGWYRLFYNIVSVVTLAPLFLHMASISEVIYSVPGWLNPVFRVLQIIGLIGAAISILQIDWMRFAGLRQLMAYFSGADLPLADEPLKTDGLYGFVRHPLYLFSLMLLWFSPTLTNTGLFFNIAATGYFVFGSIIEERRMIDYYGETYREYRGKVPWLIPFIPSRG